MRLAEEARNAEEERLRLAIEAEEQRKKEEAERAEQERIAVWHTVAHLSHLNFTVLKLMDGQNGDKLVKNWFAVNHISFIH